MKTRIEMLLIDPQMSFTCPPPNVYTDENVGIGSLYVPGAKEDMERLSDFMLRNKSKFDDIHVTLDSHHKVHIANPIFWRDPNNGEHPKPFTMITHKDVVDGKWATTLPSFQRWGLEYTAQLEKQGKYNLIIWAEHCIISTPGACVDPLIFKALNAWEEEFAVVDFVTKGSNIFVESYSALKAEVSRSDDPSTQLNTNLINTLMKADIIIASGQALSHCVLSTLKDIVEAFGDDSYVKKMVLLRDCSSIIPGFEKQTEDFLREMTARGMQISTTDKFLK